MKHHTTNLSTEREPTSGSGQASIIIQEKEYNKIPVSRPPVPQTPLGIMDPFQMLTRVNAAIWRMLSVLRHRTRTAVLHSSTPTIRLCEVQNHPSGNFQDSSRKKASSTRNGTSCTVSHVSLFSGEKTCITILESHKSFRPVVTMTTIHTHTLAFATHRSDTW